MYRISQITMTMLLLVLSFLFIGCESVTPVDANVPEAGVTQSVGSDEFTPVSWKPEVIASMGVAMVGTNADMLGRRNGVSVKSVRPEHDKYIGGNSIWNNSVDIPAGAVEERKFIAAQVVCEDAELIDNSVTTSLIVDLIADELDVLEGLVAGSDDAEDCVADALADIDLAHLRFSLYTYNIGSDAFDMLANSIVGSMEDMAALIDDGDLDAALYPSIRALAEDAVDACRLAAEAHIAYAVLDPDYDDGIVAQAEGIVAGGDDLAQERSDQGEIEWYAYIDAIAEYAAAWELVADAYDRTHLPCSAGVDFLPSQQFLTDVYVTLNWDMIAFDGDPSELQIYWYSEALGDWELVPNPIVDYEERTVSIYIDHFTRYAWGVGTTRPTN